VKPYNLKVQDTHKFSDAEVNVILMSILSQCGASLSHLKPIRDLFDTSLSGSAAMTDMMTCASHYVKNKLKASRPITVGEIYDRIKLNIDKHYGTA